MSAEAEDGGPPVSVFGQATRLLTLHAGPELIIEAPTGDPSKPAEAETDIVTLHVAGYNKIQFQCPIIESTVPEGTRIRLIALTFVNGVFVPITNASNGPWIPVHEARINSDGTPLPIASGWFVIDPSLDRDNLTITWDVYGGDGTGEFVMGDLFVELTSDPRPPFTEIPDPETPESGAIVGYWPPTELIGEIVASKAPKADGLTMYLGHTTGIDIDQNPSWDSGPPRLVMGGGTIEKDMVHVPGIPSLAAGSALFFVANVWNIGSGDKYLCAIPGSGGVDDHWIRINDITHTVSAAITEDSGGSGGTSRVATSATVIVANEWHVYGLTHDGTMLRLFIDPINGLPETSVACDTALEFGGRSFILGSGSFPPAPHNGPNNMDLGPSILYAGSLVPSAAEIAELYAVWKATYDLP